METGTDPEDTPTAAAELAEILKEVGNSLRDLDAAPARAPEMPPPESPPEPPPEPPAEASAEPVETPSPGPAEAGTEIGPAPQTGAAGARISADPARPPARPPAGPPDDQEGRLLEILGRMGPSAEDRRTAARIMKRLLRSRGASRPREPES